MVPQHPDYDNVHSGAPDMDFSILELAEDLVFTSKVRPACLPQNGEDDYKGADAIVSGWGRTSAETGTQPDVLQKARLKVLCIHIDMTSALCALGWKEGPSGVWGKFCRQIVQEIKMYMPFPNPGQGLRKMGILWVHH